MKNNNGNLPAFAFPRAIHDSYDLMNGGLHPQEGLTKREYFAGLAMQGWMSRFRPNFVVSSETRTAQIAVKYADALIAELNK
jgi:hypothetical protein